MVASKKPPLPGPMKKREIMYSTSLSADEKARWGRRFLEEGLVSDALAFFVEARSKDDLAMMRDRAIREGDAFMLRMIGNAMPEIVANEHWLALQTNASAMGKQLFSEQAGRGGKVEMPVVDAVIKADPTKHELAKEGGENGKGKDVDTETAQSAQGA
jgi:hypothetical protein